MVKVKDNLKRKVVMSMKQSEILSTYEFFPGNYFLRNESFEAVNPRDRSALLAKTNHHLAMGISVLRDRYAHFQDCFESLSPHKSAA